MTPSLLISIIALIVSVFSLSVSWRNYHRDNSDLRVSLDYWWQDDHSCFNVRVINYGRRVAYVERINLNFKNATPLQDSIAGGKAVTEAQPSDHQLYIYYPDGTPHHNPTEVKSVEVYDTLNRLYKFPGLSIKNWFKFVQLKVEIRRLWVDPLNCCRH